MKIGFLKEILISIIVIIFVVVLNIVTENYTKQCVETMNNNLDELKYIINNEEKDNEKIREKIQSIKYQWNEKYNKLAYYIEHDELEKVNTQLASLQANIDEEEYEQAMPDLDVCIFILNHIKEKSAMKIKNIF